MAGWPVGRALTSTIFGYAFNGAIGLEVSSMA
jgi:hypothetical protein